MSVLGDQRLYLLAFDHRSSFKTDLLGIPGDPDENQRRQISDLKHLIWEGFMRAVDGGAPQEECGVLVDEEFGTAVADAASDAGVRLAMSVERSGQPEFDFEYGEDFGSHIEEFDPDFAKVLVRYNPDGDPAVNSRQTAKLARLSRWLHDRNRVFLFELLVPPTDAQRRQVGGDQLAYEHRMLPALTVSAIADLQRGGVGPDIWKIEGMDSGADDARVVAQARTGGRDHVACIVLGHGEDETRVRHWLRKAASTPGYRGFAIGRTIWWTALADYLAGHCDRRTAAGKIGNLYRQMIDTYRGGRLQS
jgi:myo-inositol catabolism protein IolC